MRHLFDRPLGTSVPNGYLVKSVGVETAGAFISALGSLASTGLGAATNAAATDRAMQHQLAMTRLNAWYDEQKMRKAYDYTNNLMDKENAYNTPSAQMQRYREAGLNPYLAAGSSVGSGQSASKSAPSPLPTSTPSAPTPVYPHYDLGLSSLSDKLVQASSLRSQRIAAESQFAKSLPDLVRGLGKDGAKRVVSSVFGQDIDVQRMEDMINNEYLQQSYETKIKEIEANIKVLYGEKEAANVVALQEQSFNKMAAEIGLMASEGKLNDKKIDELSSQIVCNMAEAFKLKKEGDMFVASAAQMKAMTGLIGLQATRLRFQNKSQGFVDGSPLWNLFGTQSYNKNVVDAYDLKMDRAASQVEYFLNKWLGEYVKVSASGSVTPSVGNTYNYGY